MTLGMSLHLSEPWVLFLCKVRVRLRGLLSYLRYITDSYIISKNSSIPKQGTLPLNGQLFEDG